MQYLSYLFVLRKVSPHVFLLIYTEKRPSIYQIVKSESLQINPQWWVLFFWDLCTSHLLHNYFTTSSQLLHNYFKSTSQLPHNYFTTTSQLLHNYRVSQKNGTPYCGLICRLSISFYNLIDTGPFFCVYQEKNMWWNLSENKKVAEILHFCSMEGIFKFMQI